MNLNINLEWLNLTTWRRFKKRKKSRRKTKSKTLWKPIKKVWIAKYSTDISNKILKWWTKQIENSIYTKTKPKSLNKELAQVSIITKCPLNIERKLSMKEILKNTTRRMNSLLDHQPHLPLNENSKRGLKTKAPGLWFKYLTKGLEPTRRS